MFSRLHHVAYRCQDAQRTVDFYTKIVGLEFAAGLVSPEGHKHWHYGDPSENIHIFFKLGDGSYLAFFEIAGYPDEKPDPNTPLWVKHIAFEVPNLAFLEACKKRLIEHGVDCRGPKDHHICHSLYFEDPDGHRLEIAARDDTPGMWAKLAAEAPGELEKWNRQKARRAKAATAATA